MPISLFLYKNCYLNAACKTFNEINFATMPKGNLNILGILDERTEDYHNPYDDKNRRYQALHHVFLASAGTGEMKKRYGFIYVYCPNYGSGSCYIC